MALIKTIKTAGTQAGLESTKRTLDKLIIKECFTLNKQAPDSDSEYIKFSDGVAIFDFSGTKYHHKLIDIEINFKKWDQYRLPKHIKFNSDAIFKIDFNSTVPNKIQGYTFEVVEPDERYFRFEILGPPKGFFKSDYVIQDCSFIGSTMTLNNNTQVFTRQKYFILTNKGKLIKGKLDENKNIVQGLKKLLFNDTNKFDISLLSFRDFGVGIEPTEVGDPKNKWYDWIIRKYTPPGTTYTFIETKFPFTLSFHRLMEKMVKEYLIGVVPGINIENIDIEHYLDRDNRGIVYVR